MCCVDEPTGLDGVVDLLMYEGFPNDDKLRSMETMKVLGVNRIILL